jgi:hypothetical protein
MSSVHHTVSDGLSHRRDDGWQILNSTIVLAGAKTVPRIEQFKGLVSRLNNRR